MWPDSECVSEIVQNDVHVFLACGKQGCDVWVLLLLPLRGVLVAGGTGARIAQPRDDCSLSGCTPGTVPHDPALGDLGAVGWVALVRLVAVCGCKGVGAEVRVMRYWSQGLRGSLLTSAQGRDLPGTS